MELYRIIYKIEIASCPYWNIKNIWATNPREAQVKFYMLNPNTNIFECEHIGEKINAKCKLINKEACDVRKDNNSL